MASSLTDSQILLAGKRITPHRRRHWRNLRLLRSARYFVQVLCRRTIHIRKIHVHGACPIEEGYQTASGLEPGLRRCLAEWQSHGRFDPFPLGTHDIPDRLLIPKTLYGREREVNALLAAFDRVVAHGTPELVFVSGYSDVANSH
jgi:hypothetical protein